MNLTWLLWPAPNFVMQELMLLMGRSLSSHGRRACCVAGLQLRVHLAQVHGVCSCFSGMRQP